MSYERKFNSFRGQMPPKIWDADRLVTFTNPTLHAAEIQSLAVGLTRLEVLDYYNLVEEDLEPYDHWFFDMNYKRGRILAKQNATDSLFDSMASTPNSAMEYLRRFGLDEWQNSLTTSTNPNLGPNQAEIKVTIDN